MITSGPRGTMLTTLEDVETTNSWMPFVSITAPECVRAHEQSKPEPQNGSQLEKLGKWSTQTPQWDSGASMLSKVLDTSARTTLFVFFVLKVWIKKAHFLSILCLLLFIYLLLFLNFAPWH